MENLCKRLILTVIFIFLAVLSVAGPDDLAVRRNGRYRISVHLEGSADGAGRLYLSKYMWGGRKVVIDSASIENKTGVFSGKIYSLDLENRSCDSLFTAGEYEVSVNKKERLFSFFYSYTGKNSPDCIFQAKETGGNLARFEYTTLRKSLKERFGKENKLYIRLQNFNRLRSRIASGDSTVIENAGSEEFADNLRSLLPSIRHEASANMQGSLLETYTKYCDGYQKAGATEAQPCQSALFTDERLFYTSFGEEILLRILAGMEYDRIGSVCKNVDEILNNRYITSSRMKAEMCWSAFGYFSRSKFMNSANVASHIAENHILNKKVDVGEERYFEAGYYTHLNKGTLIGKQVPELSLKDTSGKAVPLSSLLGEYTIVYFYSDDCAYCKIETPKLVELFDTYRHTPLNVYAVYTGTDKEAWKKYIRENFSTNNPFINRIDVADLDRESNFALPFGVTATPTELLLDNEHSITGRRLRVENIRELLENEHSRHLALFKYFTLAFPEDPQSDVSEEERKVRVDRIYDLATEGGKTDLRKDEEKRRDFCDMFREAYYFLSSSEQYANQLAALYLAEKYILGMEDLWKDTTFVERTGKAVSSFRMNMLGTTAGDVLLYDVSGSPANLTEGVSRYKVLFFYKVSCSICVEYADELQSVYNRFKGKIPMTMTAVYTLDDYNTWRSFIAKKGFEWRNLWDKEGILGEKYDIENVPSIYLLDEDNTIIAKDIDPKDLDSLLEVIYRSSH